MLSTKKRESHSIMLKIDDIQYNVLDNAFYFIFDVGNPSQLAVKVPRKALENEWINKNYL